MTPLHVGTSYTHDFRFYSKGNAWYLPERVGRVTETRICVGGEGAQPPLNPHQRGTPPLKSTPYSLFMPNGGWKTVNFFSHFHGLVPDTNCNHLECFVMLGTHSQPRRGEMSHICDISPLRVNPIICYRWWWQLGNIDHCYSFIAYVTFRLASILPSNLTQ